MTAIRQTFRQQAEDCAAMGSPLMARLMSGLAQGLRPGTPLSDRILTAEGLEATRAHALPLRLAGGLHALVLTGQDPALARAYASDADPTPAALAAMARHPAFLLDWLNSPPQTNEVRRSAPLIAAAHWLTSRFRLPLVLSELGASAGLNLLWDHYILATRSQNRTHIYEPADAVLALAPDWRGDPYPDAPPTVLNRRGVDLNPLDPVTDRLRILSYIWPDQPDRLARTQTAIDLAAKLRPRIDRADAADWLETRLSTPTPGALHLIFHTVAWQYFPPTTQTRSLAAMEIAGTTGPIARLAMEADGKGPGAALTLTLWPGGETIPLGRADFHGRWVDWQAP